MTKIRKILLIVALAALCLFSQASPAIASRDVQPVRIGGGIGRYVDQELGIVCYRTRSGSGGSVSISCLPIPEKNSDV